MESTQNDAEKILVYEEYKAKAERIGFKVRIDPGGAGEKATIKLIMKNCYSSDATVAAFESVDAFNAYIRGVYDVMCEKLRTARSSGNCKGSL